MLYWIEYFIRARILKKINSACNDMLDAELICMLDRMLNSKLFCTLNKIFNRLQFCSERNKNKCSNTTVTAVALLHAAW